MSSKELIVAIAIDLPNNRFDPENMLDNEDIILEILQSLVKVNATDNTISFAHYSVAEYLKTPIAPDDNSPNPYFIDFQESNLYILQSCMFYLSCLRLDSQPSQNEMPPEYALFQYASLQWPLHAKVAESLHYDVGLIVSLLKTSENVFFRQWSDMWEDQFPPAWRCPQKLRHGKLYSVLFGLVQVSKVLFEIPELFPGDFKELNRWLAKAPTRTNEFDVLRDLVNKQEDVAAWIQRGYSALHAWLAARYFGSSSSMSGFVELVQCISEDIAKQKSLEWPWVNIAKVIKFGMLQVSALTLLALDEGKQKEQGLESGNH